MALVTVLTRVPIGFILIIHLHTVIHVVLEKDTILWIKVAVNSVYESPLKTFSSELV